MASPTDSDLGRAMPWLFPDLVESTRFGPRVPPGMERLSGLVPRPALGSSGVAQSDGRPRGSGVQLLATFVDDVAQSLPM